MSDRESHDAADRTLQRSQMHTLRERLHVLERRYHDIETAIMNGANRMDVHASEVAGLQKEMEEIKKSLDGVTSP